MVVKTIDSKLVRDHPGISVDPEIMGGTPCVKGTRIPLYIILDALEAGYSFDQIIKNYHSLTKKDIQAVIRFSSSLTSFLAHANPAG